MQDIPLIRIGHLSITDHLVLGITCFREKANDITLSHVDLEAISMNSFPQIVDAFMNKQLQGAFIPIPAAMDLFSKGMDIRLLMFTHRSGSVMVKSKRIKKLTDFKTKVILLPCLQSMQTMLSHKLFAAAGLKLGTAGQADADVLMEFVSPVIMPEMMAADTDNDIGGFFVAEPFGTQAVLEGSADMFLSSDSLFKDHPCCALVMHRDIIERHPDAVEELIENLILSGHILETRSRQDIITMSQSFFNQDIRTITHFFEKASLCFTPSKLLPDEDMLKIIHTYLCKHAGILSGHINIDRFVMADFARKAVLEYAH